MSGSVRGRHGQLSKPQSKKTQIQDDTSGLTSLPHASDALHVAALCERGADVGCHRTSRDSIATDAFGAVERTGVLRQANETMLTRGIRSTCGRHVSTSRPEMDDRCP